ncbi:MAG: hypothetical protein J5645_09580 [Lachnospiraceae bacterium]|nr:hypothetical protein [Lachnospiraceae bacterium]
MKKVVCVVASVFAALMLSILVNEAYAYTYEDTIETQGAGTRKYEWEWSWDINYGETWCPIGTFVIGFETDWINEYYSWSRAEWPGNPVYTKAGVKNAGQSWTYASWKGNWSWSKEEIRAKKDTAYFRVMVGTNYGEGYEWHNFLFLTNLDRYSNYK